MEKTRGGAFTATHPASFLNKPSNEVICRRMTLFFRSCFFFITSSLIWLFSFLALHLFRIRKGDSSHSHDLQSSVIDDSKRVETCSQVRDSCARNYDCFEEKDSPPCLTFKFQYQLSAHQNSGKEEPQQSDAKQNTSSLSTSTHSYQFASAKDLSGFVEQPEVKTFVIQESVDDPDIFSLYDNKNCNTLLSPKAANLNAVHTMDGLDGTREENFPISCQPLEKEKPVISETNLSGELERAGQAKFLLQEFSGFDSDTDTLSASDGYSVKELAMDSDSEGMLSDHEHEAEGTAKYSIDAIRFRVKLLQDIRRLEEAQLQLVHDRDEESAPEIGRISLANNHLDENLQEHESDFSFTEKKELNQGEVESNQAQKFGEPKLLTLDPLTDSIHDELHATEKQIILRKNSDEILYPTDLVKLDGIYDECLDEQEERINSTESRDSIRRITNIEDAAMAELDKEDVALMAELDELEREEQASKENKGIKEREVEDLDDDDDDDELESLWEHEDLIEQLKMELKRVRATGLPTIKEESETPKTVDDLKPWKMDEKFLHENPMDELYKFYKSYRERIRKLDILSNQKMYAIGLLQLKDPLHSMGPQKSLIPAIASILSQSFGSCSGKFGISPSEKFIKELQNDLEMVYVGQTCLSWEFLRWQYEKARQLPESDPYRGHQYNQVAGEFQQFQVMMQRFIEDEAFQGPRLPNFVKNRCSLQNLLLVPVIREDSLKEKREDQRKGNHVITSEILEEIMEESIGIFWEFVKADKDETPGILKGLMGPRVEFQDPTDSEFMAEIQSNLHKKEKKLKDIVRTGNCLVKKFKKPKEDRLNQDIFFSHVDLKLIARVLRMSRVTTEQLVWCHAKLSCITFTERKIHREPSFLLFPC
ncbi:hypothetical protein Cni_G29083 [Canna indica]|uniref:Ribosomal protein L34Ae n=1 Tax=Canna indica TaxID=4628 RepID=A0AAQ3QQX5_9LILI|nr:hypothetical protein Cni_G29083 [Canna indica]